MCNYLNYPQFGEEVWIQIKNEANCDVKTGDWIRYENYEDIDTFALINATCKVLKVDGETVLEIFGQYFMEYVRQEGYLNMLNVLGSTLREWLTNVNDLHTHLRSSLPHALFPEFWCVDDEEVTVAEDGSGREMESMILHYYSQRGSVMANLNVGIVKEVAKYFFDLKIYMIRIATQDVDDSQFTSWRIIVRGPWSASANSNKAENENTSSQQEGKSSNDGDGDEDDESIIKDLREISPSPRHHPTQQHQQQRHDSTSSSASGAHVYSHSSGHSSGGSSKGSVSSGISDKSFGGCPFGF